MRLDPYPRRLPVQWRDLCVGDVILVNRDRLRVRDIDRSILSKNLGALVCPADSADDEGSYWLAPGSEFEVA